MGFSKSLSSDRKQVPRDASSSLKRSLVIFILGGLSFYLLFFGIALNRHGKRMDRFEKRANRIYVQLAEKNEQHTLERTPRKPVNFRSEGPEVFNPISVFCAFFCVHRIDSEVMKNLKEMLVSFKDHLSEINLAEINLSGKETDLSEADLSKAYLRKADFRDTNLSHAVLRGTDLREARLSGAELGGANLSKADLSGADLRGATLVGADLREANFFYSDFLGADLSQAMLRGVKLSGADFRKVNFSDADLSGAILSGARLNGANLAGVDLVEADLRYADLRDTIGLTQEMLDHVIVDENTRLPEGLKVP